MNAALVLLPLAALVSGCAPGVGKADASGTFEATEVIVSSEATGKILELNLQEGQLLSENEKVGHIDDIQLVLKKKQLVATMNGIESKRPDISVQIAATAQQIDAAITEKNRIQKLFDADAVNQKQLDDINTQITTLEKQVAAQRESLVNGDKGITADSSAIEMQIAQIDDQIARCDITSPINGTVLVQYAEKGEFASAGKAMFKIADMERMYLRAYVTSAQLSKIKLGQSAKVTADYGVKNSREYGGTINWISSEAEFTPKTILTQDERANLVYAIKISVPNDGYLKIGMYGNAKF